MMRGNGDKGLAREDTEKRRAEVEAQRGGMGGRGRRAGERGCEPGG